jgi:Sugar-transfer associated ATP-grasp
MSTLASIATFPAAVATAPKGPTLYDREHQQEKFTADFASLLRTSSQRTGQKPLRIVSDYWSVQKGPGKVSLKDYFLYGLYDNSKYSLQDKRRFISDELHWPITHACCDMRWQGMTEDKWMSYSLLERFGLRIPQTVAVVDQSIRCFGKTPKLSTPGAFKTFIVDRGEFPLFCKANDGLGSFGVFIITGVDGDVVLLDQAAPMTFEQLFSDVIGTRTYVIQPCLSNHSVIRGMTKYLATVRMVNLVTNGRVSTPFAAMKIPSPKSIADNFWRAGNMLADVDVETGEFRRVIVGKGTELREIQAHPDTGAPMQGLMLPYWKQLREMNDVCMSYFAPIKYSSLDIAITDTGPVIVEVNTGGSFQLPQMASGRGMLTDEVLEFFKSCGYKFKGKI